MMLAAIGIVVTVLIGYFITVVLWPEDLPLNLVVPVAIPVGIGLCSIIFILLRRPMFVVEFAVLIAAGIVWFLRKRPHFPKPGSLASWRPGPAWILLACAAGMALSYCIIRIEHSPHGDWDAMAIWNSHARYLYRDGPFWRKNILNSFHPDYPLLVPATTARLWRYMGAEIPDAAGYLGMLYTFAALAVLMCSLVDRRSARRAVIFGLALLGTPFYLDYGVSGSADVPFSLFVLATIALIVLQSESADKKRRLMVLAGFTAGCAGWTKNEGVLFITVVIMALLAPVIWRPRQTIRNVSMFLLGLALPMGVIAWFKLSIAPPNDIVGGRSSQELIRKILDPDRYVTVVVEFSRNMWSFGNWLVSPFLLLLAYAGLNGIDRKMLRNEGVVQGMSICLLLMAGYAAIYVISPEDLQWHIESSLPRLYLHVWPSFLLLTGLVTARTE